MFSKTIIDSDVFLTLPASSQALYFHLGLHADDDGFVNSPMKIIKIVGADKADFENLISNNLIIHFESGIVAITHWKIHNYIQKDRYHPTIYQKEFSSLSLDENKMYTRCIQPVYKLEAEVSICKDRLDKVSIDKSSFIPPAIEEIKEFCKNNNYKTDAEKFFDYYNSNGWKVGKNPMKDWHSALRMWERNEKPTVKSTSFKNFNQPKTDYEEIKVKKRQQLIEKLKAMETANS